ncbi:helix-turn-helix domain-containing protein [Rathayibacter sp. KR2-224]|uniref:helix-turn-helix domain-containing protein n=1 Tax=Rathayibacter sp. KR2-224 TaxID=3400913 RepID=UPI003C0F96DD
MLSALSLLEEVARIGPGATAQQISESLRMPRATAYRLLNLLVQEEYLVRLPDLSGFALGARVAQLGGGSSAEGMDRQVDDILAVLRGRIRGGVHLVAYAESGIILRDVDPDFPLSDPERIVQDLAVSALGRLLLAEREGRTPVFAVQENGLIVGYGCLAAAVRNASGALVAGIALSLPAGRLLDTASLLGQIEQERRRLESALV